MRIYLYRYWERIGLVDRFMLTALVTLVFSGLVLGWFISKQIGMGVIQKTSSETSLYVDSFLDPTMQWLASGNQVSDDQIAALNQLVYESPLGQHIVSCKIIDTKGQILYSTYPEQIGQTVPIDNELGLAMDGTVYTKVSNLDNELDHYESEKWDKLLETISPIVKHGTSEVIGVVQFYQTMDRLDSEIHKAQLSSLGMLTGQSLLVFLLLSTFVRHASNTIDQQKIKLNGQVSELTVLLAQNEQLSERVRRAVSRAITFNEHFLKRIRAELHDGPVQELGYVLLRLDSLHSPKYLPPELLTDGHGLKDELIKLKTSLQHTIAEIRETSTSIGLPRLDQASLTKTLELVSQAHEQRTGSEVKLTCINLTDQASLSAKISLYRVVQEALNNSFRHAGGIGQQVIAKMFEGKVFVEISDQGKGFDQDQEIDQSRHLGIIGMRDRVESLGGIFSITSSVNHGTKIIACIPLQTDDLVMDPFTFDGEG